MRGAAPASVTAAMAGAAAAALPLLAELIKTTSPEEHPRYFRAFDFHTENPELKKRALESLLE